MIKRWKKYFEHLLNPPDIPAKQAAELGALEGFQSISMVQVTVVVTSVFGGDSF